MKNILLPTDFSENSWNAISFALNLFKNERCTFFLLNTYTPILHNTEYLLINPSDFKLVDIYKETSVNGLKEINERIDDEFKNPNHHISQVSSFSTLIGEIEDLHEEYLMDFIVMGTKGATGAKEILIGSNTVHVLNKIKFPIIAVPENFHYEAPNEILFPSDYNIEFNEKQIKPIVDIAKEYHSRVYSLHVLYGKQLTDKQEENRQILALYFKDTRYLFHTEENKNIPEAIAKFQLSAGINFLVMINNKHSFFENLFFKNKINHIGHHLNIPFLVIPS